jgi:hypothetical protein
MEAGLTAGAVGAICWFVAYILIIRRGFMDKSSAMPLVALCANLSWEFIFSFIHPPTNCPADMVIVIEGFGRFTREITPNAAQEIVNFVWFVMDLFIVGAYLAYGRRDFTPLLPQRLFYPTFLVGLVMALIIVGTSVQQFDDCQGLYTAFVMNLIMAILFPIFLLERGSVRGQSFYIAFFKMFGSLGFAIRFYTLNPNSAFLTSQYIFIFLFDLLYLVLIYRQSLKENINPLMRL